MKVLERIIMTGRVDRGITKDNRTILVNVSEYEDDQGNRKGGQNEQILYTGGVYFCPDPPTDAGECTEIVALKGEDDCDVIAFRDLRLHARVNAKEGELGIAQYGGGFVSLAWDDDHKGTMVSILAPRLDDNGAIDKAHGMIFDPTASNASIQLLHLEGSAILMSKDGAITLSAKGGKTTLTVDPDVGIQLATDKGISFAGGIVAGSTDQAAAVALIQPLIDVVNALVIALNSSFGGATAFPGVVSAGWPLAIAVPGGLTDKIALLSTLGTATTLKASPT